MGETVRPCGLCQEANMVLKKNRDGNFMVGCSGFPQCRNAIWLPGPLIEATVTTHVCQSCSPGPVYRIQFKFRQYEIPPGFNVNHLGCIGGCDDTLRQLIEICGTGSRGQARSRTSTASSDQQQASTRQVSCAQCHRSGHTSSSCPYQRPQHQHVPSHENGEPSISCSTCGSSCALRTANTASNRGRKFYSCPSQACNFSVWEDNLANGTNTRSFPPANNGTMASASARASRGRGRRSRGEEGRRGHGGGIADSTFVSATGDPVSGSRRCYVCGDPSHFANVCPNRGS